MELTCSQSFSFATEKKVLWGRRGLNRENVSFDGCDSLPWGMVHLKASPQNVCWGSWMHCAGDGRSNLLLDRSPSQRCRAALHCARMGWLTIYASVCPMDTKVQRKKYRLDFPAQTVNFFEGSAWCYTDGLWPCWPVEGYCIAASALISQHRRGSACVRLQTSACSQLFI